MLNVGITIDAAGTSNEFKILLDILNDFEIKSTFFIGMKIKPQLIKLISKKGHENGSGEEALNILKKS